MRKFSGAKYFDHAENTLDYAEILTVNNEFRGANSIGFETGSIRTAQQWNEKHFKVLPTDHSLSSLIE